MSQAGAQETLHQPPSLPMELRHCDLAVSEMQVTPRRSLLRGANYTLKAREMQSMLNSTAPAEKMRNLRRQLPLGVELTPLSPPFPGLCRLEQTRATYRSYGDL